LFKLVELEPGREDYGHSVRYLGTAPYQPDRFDLDKRCGFRTGEQTAVCGNTFLMLARSRLAPFFEFTGDGGGHAGVFSLSDTNLPFDEVSESSTTGCC
jgi:hypothetical protein